MFRAPYASSASSFMGGGKTPPMELIHFLVSCSPLSDPSSIFSTLNHHPSHRHFALWTHQRVGSSSRRCASMYCVRFAICKDSIPTPVFNDFFFPSSLFWQKRTLSHDRIFGCFNGISPLSYSTRWCRIDF